MPVRRAHERLRRHHRASVSLLRSVVRQRRLADRHFGYGFRSLLLRDVPPARLYVLRPYLGTLSGRRQEDMRALHAALRIPPSRLRPGIPRCLSSVDRRGFARIRLSRLRAVPLRPGRVQDLRAMLDLSRPGLSGLFRFVSGYVAGLLSPLRRGGASTSASPR